MAIGLHSTCQPWHTYDPLNRLTNVLDHGSSIAGYAYDLVGNLQGLRYGNGVTNQYRYDSLNRLTNLVWGTSISSLASFAYRLGATGNRTNLSENLSGTSSSYQWQYDRLYRLTNETVGITSPGNLFYQYDGVGNRTNRTAGLTLSSQSLSYNTNDWLTTDKYDANGNTTTNSSSNVYQYDVINHITNATVNSAQILMTYDGDGNRVSKTVGGTTVFCLVDDFNPSGYSQVLEEYRGMTLTNVYNYGLSLISQRTPNVSTNYFISDGHGSTRMLTDNDGTVVNVLVYDSYGNLIASNGVLQTAYLYSGQQFDPDLGLYLNRARYLNAETGRFWTADSTEGDKEEPLSLHKYLYAADDPVDESDPSGDDYSSVVVNDRFSINISSIGGLLAQNLPSIEGEKGLGVYRANTVKFRAYTGAMWLTSWRSFRAGAGTSGQPFYDSSIDISWLGNNGMSTSIEVFGHDACNTAEVPAHEPMNLPDGSSITACGSIQATVYGSPYGNFSLDLIYDIETGGEGVTYAVWGYQPKQLLTQPIPEPCDASAAVHFSGQLDANGMATFTYVPSVTAGPGGDSDARGSLKVENLK